MRPKDSKTKPSKPGTNTKQAQERDTAERKIIETINQGRKKQGMGRTLGSGKRKHFVDMYFNFMLKI